MQYAKFQLVIEQISNSLYRFLNNNQMEKVSIMEYLPEGERVKLMNLIKKLGEETIQKEKYKKLYEKVLNDYENLKEDYEKLQQRNMQLKSQISASRLALTKAKQAFMASSKSAQKNKRSDACNSREKSPIKQTLKYDFEIEGSAQKYVDTRIQEETIVISKPPRPETGKSLRNSRQQESFMSQTTNSKKQQIINMKQQIKQLTYSIKKKKREDLKLSEKMKLGEEILQRFRKSKQKRKRNSLYSSEDSSDNQSSNAQIKRTSAILETPQRAISKPETKFRESINIKSTQQIKNKSQDNQEKEDMHPNRFYKEGNPNKEKKASKKEILDQSYASQKKNQRNPNLYDESFFDLIKQLNDQ